MLKGCASFTWEGVPAGVLSTESTLYMFEWGREGHHLSNPYPWIPHCEAEHDPLCRSAGLSVRRRDVLPDLMGLWAPKRFRFGSLSLGRGAYNGDRQWGRGRSFRIPEIAQCSLVSELYFQPECRWLPREHAVSLNCRATCHGLAVFWSAITIHHIVTFTPNTIQRFTT